MSIKFIHSDCLKWAKSLPNKSVDHIITDYEYGADFPFVEFLRICKGTILTFCSEYDNPLQGNRTEIAYWIKTPSTKNYKKKLGRFVEQIHILKQDEYNIFNTDLHWSNYTGVYTDMVEEKGWLWRKPLSLIERLVRIYTNENDLIADPFCGYGTTGNACKKLNRNFVGIDTDSERIKWCRENIERRKK